MKVETERSVILTLTHEEACQLSAIANVVHATKILTSEVDKKLMIQLDVKLNLAIR